jgi:phage terminase small subunit
MSKVSEEFLPPVDLSESSKSLWKELVPRRAKSPERLELLSAALRCRDRAAELRQVLAAEGLFIVTPKSGHRHAHPGVAMLSEVEKQFAKLWLSLKFEYWPAIDRG